jgi:glycosyltransferase involved in cell wall biosynthesis
MPPVTDWIDPCGVRVWILAGRWREPWRSYMYALGLAWTLFRERRNYDIAYFINQGLHLVTGLPVARLLGKRIVMKFAASGQVVMLKDSWLGRLELRFLRWWASSILILNPGMVEEAKDVGFDAARIDWMPNPVDTDEFRPCSAEERARTRNELDVAPDAPVIVFVGRLAHQKKLPWTLGAFARVVREQPRAILAVIGDGPLRQEIGQLARDLGLENNVRFTGRLDAKGLLKWLQAGDVYTLISAIEGLPCSVIEAMSAGIAPVLSDIPAHTQLVDHEVHGLVTELGNEEAVARGLLRLLGDPQLRTRLGAAARRRMLDQYSMARVADHYEKLFERVLDS